MNIFAYFQKKGINTVDASFYRDIKKWESWYRGNVKNFSWYKVYSGQGTYNKKKRKSMGMAKKVCEDIADLLMNERVKITLSDKHTDEFVSRILKENRFYVMCNEFQERKAATGTAAYVPCLCNMEVDETGEVLTGKIGIDYYSAGEIYPISWKNGIVTECAFITTKTVRRKKYIQIQHHSIEKAMYIIENAILECMQGSQEGKELTPEEWEKIPEFAGIIPRIETGSSKPQFAIDKLNIVNNASEDESNPMGVAIFANAIDVLQKLDIEYDSYCNEFDLGRKRIFVVPEMLNYKDGSPAFDTEDTTFYRLPEDYLDDKNGEAVKEINMELRTEDHNRAITDDLNYLSLKCGFGTERYRFENAGVKTATEVISENSDMYRNIQKHEIILDDVIKQVIRIIIRLGIVTGEKLDENTEITIDFDDSIIEDKQAERNTDKGDVAIGAMQLYEYRQKWYGETKEQAQAAVAQPAEVIE